MKIKLLKTLIAVILFTIPVMGFGQIAPDLKSAGDFGVLAGTAISFNGPVTVINGMDVGLYPGNLSSITGNYEVNNGRVIAADSPDPAPAELLKAKQDLSDAYDFAAGQTPTHPDISGDQGGITLFPGVYKSTSTLSIANGNLTLDAQGNEDAIWIFQITSDFTTIGGGPFPSGSGGNVILINGAKADNVYWQIGGSATIGNYTDFKGNILAHTSITMNSNSEIEGRVLAMNAAVTFEGGSTMNEPADPQLAVSKTADETQDVEEGQTITYTYIVTNDGNVTFSDITLVDEHEGTGSFVQPVLTQGIATSLAPGESLTYEATYVITQDDIDNQVPITNLATATGIYNGVEYTDTDGESVTPKEDAPSIAVTKSADPQTYGMAGDQITYTILVENTGNVTIIDIDVVDDLTGDTWFIASLESGESQTFTALYVITQDDVDAGSVENEASANGTTAQGDDVTDTDNETVLYVEPDAPSIAVTKSADPQTYGMAGDQITYTILVENTGNVTIIDIDVVDDLTGDTWFITSLAPGESETFTATYFITQEDMDAAQVMNTATADGSDPDGNTVSDSDDETVTAINLLADITLTKTANPQIYGLAGDVITYTIVVENTGNVTIIDIDVVDDLTGDTWFITSLAPGESEAFTTTYMITRADLDNLSVNNIATATGFDPAGNTVSDLDDAIVKALRIPGGLTPGTQFDRLWHIEGLENYPDNKLRIYNRWGTLVFEASPYQNDWEGVPNRGRILTESDGRLPAGTYYYLLELEPGQQPFSGYIYLIKP